MDVKTAGRTVDLFELFAEQRTPLTLSEIARGLDAPQSSCFNLVRSLVARGFLYNVGGKKQLYPTRKIFEIGDAIIQHDPLVPRLKGRLEELRDLTQETTILGAQQGSDVLYLAVAEGPQTIRYMSYPGEIKTFHASAIGKALLMVKPEEERLRMVQKIKKAKVTDQTIITDEGLMTDIKAASERGYTMTKGENVVDVMAIGLPIIVDDVPYAIAVAGPIGRIELAVDECVQHMRTVFSDYDVGNVNGAGRKSRVR